MIYIFLLVFIFFIVLSYGIFKNAEIYFSPVIGFMVGTLISYEEINNNIEYTLQCCLGFISLTVTWEKN